MKKVYLGNRQLTTLATREEGGGGGNDELAKSLIDRSITSVDIPNGVTKIGNGAFAYYSGLTSVNIPNTVTSIGDYAFNWCSSLADVTIYSTIMIYYKWAMFANIASNAVLHVPQELVSEYQADSKWSSAFGGGIVAI